MFKRKYTDFIDFLQQADCQRGYLLFFPAPQSYARVSNSISIRELDNL